MIRVQLHIPITGMTCANCVTTVERILQKKTKGITEASVNLANEEAQVVFDTSVTNLSEIKKSLEKAGYGISTQHVHLRINGMTCANCASTIERILYKKIQGLISAAVNLADDSVNIEYIPSLASIEDIKAAIRTA